MKRIIVQIIVSVFCITAQAQKISNIRAEQHGQDIVVLYSLETTSPCEVRLFLSQDNGATWGSALKNVSGDVGENISAGEKKITWKVLEDRDRLVGDRIRFKVIAKYKGTMKSRKDETHNFNNLPFVKSEIKINPSPYRGNQNVFFNREYTLFDHQHPDWPIFPVNKNGKIVFQIYYSSNEDPQPYYGEFTPEELERYLYYKFKNKQSCLEFCRSKAMQK
jgi:hypothetical protein